MFEQSLIGGKGGARRPWAMGGSLVLQAVAVIALLVAPLLNTYELAFEEWADQSFLLAPPPPPAPPAPVQAKVQPARAPERFEDVLRQPQRIPERVVLIEDRLDLAPRTAPAPGLEGGLPDGMSGSVLGLLASNLAPPPVPKPIQVGGRIQAARLLNRVVPIFPQEAIEAGIEGQVVLHAVIARDGQVKELSVESGHPMLAPAALEAVRQWRYKPLRLNGQTVEVETTIEVRFTLVRPAVEESDPVRQP